MVVPLQKLDFNVLASHYYPELMQKALKACKGNYTFAEEAVQDTMITAWTRRDQVTENFDSWISSILFNKVRDAHRKERSKNYFMAPLPQGYDRPEPAQAQDSEIYNKILNEIDSLPQNYRDVCKLTLLEDFEQQDIAKKLNLPLGTVQSRQSRSKTILQNKLRGLKNG